MANEGNAQSVRNYQVFIELNDASVLETFDLIEQRSDFRFIFKNEDLNKKVKLNLKAGRYTVAKILELVSKEADLKFKQVNQNISATRIIKADKQISDNERVTEMVNITISGRVTSSEDNLGLPQATVQLKGSTNGVLTDTSFHFIAIGGR